MPMALAAFHAGKHVMVERPIGRTFAEAERMVKAADKAGKFLMVAMNHRFRPDSMILQNFIDEGELGDIFLIRSGWMKRASESGHPHWKYDPRFSGGGVMMDLGIQMLDLCLWLLRFPQVIGVSAKYFHSIMKKKVEDQICVFLRLEKGKLITVDAGWNLPAQQTIAFTVIHGEKGTAWLNPLRIHRRLHDTLMELTPGKRYTHIELYQRSFENEVRHFVESVRNNQEPISSGRESLKVMKIMDMIYHSAKEDRAVQAEVGDI
jgi:predicted dehydrogenase